MTRNKLTSLIDAHQMRLNDEPRDYIGASSIGSDCYRQIWYEFKGFKGEPVTPKIRRARDIGKKLEGLILDWAEEAGLEIARLWYDLQSKTVSCFKGHLDSVWLDKKGKAKAIIEIKTAKSTSFNLFVKKGLKAWNPQYYAQIQSYMGMSGIHLAYEFMLNKDSSDISDELITFDKSSYKSLEEKALMISEAVVPPPRINGSPLYFKCKMCKFNKECHQ